MTMTLPASPPAPAKSGSMQIGLLVIVGLVGAIQGLGGLSDMPSPLPGAVRSIFGFAALALAVFGRLRYAIAALAVLALSVWANEMSSVIRHGLSLTADAFVNAGEIYTTIVSPVLALLALAAAWFNRYLAAATIIVMLPPIVTAAGVAAFAISVIMYGF